MDEIVKDFLIESNENLDRLDQELVQLESQPGSKELLGSIFRTIHTIKGSCGFLGFARLEKVAHAGENLLSLLRDGQLRLNPEGASGLMAMVDAVRRMLNEIEATETDGDNDYPELREELKRLQSLPAPDAGTNDTPRQDAAAPAIHSTLAATATTASDGSSIAAASPSTASAPAPPEQTGEEHSPAPVSRRPAMGKVGGWLVERGIITAEQLSSALRQQEGGDRRPVGEILCAMGLCTQADIVAAQQVIESRAPSISSETIRVGLNLLDKLMNLVGELVLARNQMLQFSSNLHDASFQAVSQRMNLITTELQEEVMKTRMQPIGNIWSKFPRTVRDLAHTVGKEVRLELEGQGTEMDRTIVEAIKDPLNHLVRNAVDHGIEQPEVRLQVGKEAQGCLKLRAFHEGGAVTIEIIDDGAGLNSERIRKKAVERGLISLEQAARLPEREVFNMIFFPGFSTAEKVTNVSGRGVGMDVVKINVEKIGGTVDVQSAAGKGTTVRVKIPLTLAIIPALVTRCAGERFAIPQVSLTELLRLESGKGIEMVHGAPVYRLRGHLLPLVKLREILELDSEAGTEAGEKDASTTVNIVVLQTEGRQFGLVVDEILDTQEIVVKPLGQQLKSVSIYSGATIMGDGRVALILDVAGLAQQAHVVAAETRAEAEAHEKHRRQQEEPEREALLLVENGREGRVAIPLRQVARLEEFPATIVERSGGQEVAQYRGEIIPLLRLAAALPGSVLSPNNAYAEASASEGNTKNTIQVVMYTEAKKTVGLVVDRIVDIVDEDMKNIEPNHRQAGVVGSFVSQRRVTDLVDVSAIVRTGVPGLFDSRAAKTLRSDGAGA